MIYTTRKKILTHAESQYKIIGIQGYIEIKKEKFWSYENMHCSLYSGPNFSRFCVPKNIKYSKNIVDGVFHVRDFSAHRILHQLFYVFLKTSLFKNDYYDY
jgi:hypothetical protein